MMPNLGHHAIPELELSEPQLFRAIFSPLLVGVMPDFYV